MKKYKIIYLLILLPLFLVSCEEWLKEDVKPQGEYLEENFFKNDVQTEAGLNAAYMYQRQQFVQDPLYSWMYCGWGFMSNFPSDDVHPGGENLADLPPLQDLGEYDWSTSNMAIYFFWRKSYFGINRCNLVIHNPDYESERLTEMQAEARFLRALYYFQLVQLYKDVPLVDKALTPSEYNQEKVPYTQVLEFIVADLKKAQEGLKYKSELTRKQMYRPTVGAAQSLLGKVYLYMASPHYNMGSAYYDSSRIELARVISSGEYDLEPVFDNIWLESYEHGIESIFETEYSDGSTYGSFDHGLWGSGNIEVQMGGARVSGSDTIAGSCWGWSIPTQNLLDAYDDPSDPDPIRKDGTIITRAFIQSTGGSISSYPVETFANAYSKKRMCWTYLISPTSSQWGWPTNERLLRYADVLLMYAEALVNGGGGDALGQDADYYVNLVRTRAQLDPKSNVTMNDIKRERRLELAFEGHRWQDLVRWGDADAVLNQFITDDGVDQVISPFIKGRHEHYPIPQIEIQSSEGALEQNPGYN